MEQEKAPAEASKGRRPRLNPTIVAAVIGLIGVVGVPVITFWLSDSCPERETGVQITSPTSGKEVSHKVPVQGIAPIGEDRLWVIYRPLDNGHYYPIEDDIVPDPDGSDGAWEVTAFIGDSESPEDIGKTFEIIVVKTSEKVYKDFQDYNDEGREKLPDCAVPVARVRVVRGPG